MTLAQVVFAIIVTGSDILIVKQLAHHLSFMFKATAPVQARTYSNIPHGLCFASVPAGDSVYLNGRIGQLPIPWFSRLSSSSP